MNFVSRIFDEEPKMSDDVFEKLRKGVEKFSARQSLLCKYIIENYQKVAFWSVEELSHNSGISPATVVRTVKSLGFSSYHQLLKCFENLILDKETSVFWETKQSLDREPETYPSFTWIARDNIQALNESITQKLIDDLKNASHLLQKARRIFILAMRSSRAAGVFLYSILTQAFDNIYLIRNGIEELYDQMVDMTPEDALIVISIGGPHYTYTTIRAAEYAYRNGIPTVVVTNDQSAPAMKFAHVGLVVAQTHHHYSIVPAMTLLETIAVELGQNKKAMAVKKLQKLEPVLIEEGITT